MRTPGKMLHDLAARLNDSMATMTLLALSVLTLAGCRDDVDPFSADARDPVSEGDAVQLTFNPRDDRTPAWSATGDSIYYTADSLSGFLDQPGLLLAVPFQGGGARRVLETVQSSTEPVRRLMGPTLDPTGERLAVVEIERLWPSTPQFCPILPFGPSCTPSISDARPPALREFSVRARRLDRRGPIDADPALFVMAPGVVLDEVNTPHNHVIHDYPAHQLFEAEGAAFFRPSWDPAGERVAFSDGLDLMIWSVGAEQAQTIPGTRDGVTPAWSPDGDWIAFTRLERADSIVATCEYRLPFTGELACEVQHTEYVIGRRLLSLVRPDGSELMELGEGEEPAWSPDGATLYFRRGDGIWRSAIDGSGGEPVPRTLNGREPAVSPDGRFLAFSRLNERGDYDLWVIPLDSLP